MIYHNITNELFATEVKIKTTCKYTPDFATTINIENIETYKQNLERDILIRELSNMLSQRMHNYTHGEHLKEANLLAINKSYELINSLRYSSLKLVLEHISKTIINHLNTITPNINSRFYANFAKKVSDIKEFSEKRYNELNQLNLKKVS